MLCYRCWFMAPSSEFTFACNMIRLLPTAVEQEDPRTLRAARRSTYYLRGSLFATINISLQRSSPVKTVKGVAISRTRYSLPSRPLASHPLDADRDLAGGWDLLRSLHSACDCQIKICILASASAPEQDTTRGLGAFRKLRGR